MNEVILGVLFFLAGVLVSIGAFVLYVPAGFVTAGVLLGGWAWLMFGDVS